MNFQQCGFPPLYSSRISAGFPQTADDLVEMPLDLNEHLIKHPSATYFVRVSGDSMINAGIHPGDILIVDRAVTPINGSVVVASIDGEFTVKRLIIASGRRRLASENPRYGDINFREEDLEIWGVVTHSIRDHISASVVKTFIRS